MWRAAVVLAFACSSKSEPVKQPPKPPPVAVGSAYAGPPESGPCNDAHDCVLRDDCGCRCEGVLATAPEPVPCEESCPGENICSGYTVICDLAQHRCGAIPKAR